MPAATHLYRRKAVYYWRRRLPPTLGSWFHKRNLFMSLQTPDASFARRLVILLDAKLEEVVTAFENAEMHLTPSQLDGVLRDVVTKHLQKLERLAASAKSFAGFDASQAERDDRRAAWTYRMLSAQGASAVVRPVDESQMLADGLSSTDVLAVTDHLEMLKSNKLIPTRHGKLVKKRSRAERWSDKSKRQAEQTFSMLAKFMHEEQNIKNMSAVRQKDLAALVNFLEFEIYKHHGKSEKDKDRSIAEMRIFALSKKEELRGLEAGTLNRHLTFIDQLFDLAEAEGIDLDPKLKIGKLRAIDSTDERERDERLKFPLASIEKLFQQPPFANCLARDRQWEKGVTGGSLVFHGALYFIPMLTFYGGGRREEYCGLMIDDVIEDNGRHPYLHIAKNKYRRIKNIQSKRNIVLHPELIRLGFLRYVAKIRSLGYDLVFPDLYSPTTNSLLGDRYYKIFKPVLVEAGITEEGLGSHAIRHAFGAILKKKKVAEESRADMLGHAGKTETSERYCEATEIEQMYRLILKMPAVTRHIIDQPINLPEWLVKKLSPPFSHPSRAKVR